MPDPKSDRPAFRRVTQSHLRPKENIEPPPLWVSTLLDLSLCIPVGATSDEILEITLEGLVSVVPEVSFMVTLTNLDNKSESWLMQSQSQYLERGAKIESLSSIAFLRHYPIAFMPGSELIVASNNAELKENDSVLAIFSQKLAKFLGKYLFEASSFRHEIEMPPLSSQDLERLAQTEKLAGLGQIAAGVVHELNNPLTAILAYSEHLKRFPDQETKNVASKILEAADRMASATKELMVYVRPAQETMELVDFSVIFDSSIALCAHLLAMQNITVTRNYRNDYYISCRKQELIQVFVNLITNACHAMPPVGGELVLDISIEQSRLVSKVTDNGHGIAPENLRHLFTPFFTTKKQGEGTGLGLSIVKNIIDGHGGSIQVESRQFKPTGTTFVVAIPLTPGPQRF